MTTVLTTAATGWIRAAKEVGLALPAEVQAARERLERAEAELTALPPRMTVPSASQLAVGTSLQDAQAEADRLADAAAQLEEARRAGYNAVHGARFALNKTVALCPEELILGIRDLVDEIIEQGRGPAAILAEFAPGYSPADIVHRGQPKHLKAYQEAMESERRFGLLISSWRATFKDATHATNPRRPLQDIRWVEPVHWFWARPELVVNPAMNGQKRNRSGLPMAPAPSVLGVASESPDCEFRLATPQEVADVYNSGQAEKLAAKKLADERAREARRGRTRGMRAI